MSDGVTEAYRKKEAKNPLIVNVFGGPGSGKSIIVAHVFAKLKWQHFSAEMALEYVKDEVWEENSNAISNQLFILGNQHQRLHRLLDKVDIILVDSPLLLSIHYDIEKNEYFKNYVLDKFNQYNNLNIFLERNSDEYETKGRLQLLPQAKHIDDDLKELLNKNDIKYITYKMEKKTVKKLTKLIKKKI
jgi:nicotinamide riboside kinase